MKQNKPNIIQDFSVGDGFRRRESKAPGGASFTKSSTQFIAKKIDDFARPEGFNPRFKDSPEIPDATKTGRRAIRKSDINMQLPDSKAKRKSRLKSSKWTIIRRKLPVLSCLLLLFAGFVTGSAYLRASQIFQNGDNALALNKELDPSLLNGEGDGRVNILLLGKGGPGHTAPDLTDTLIIASIDPIQKDAALLSVPRDFYVQVPGNGSMKINSVYATYKQQALYQGKSAKEADSIGIEAIEKTMSEVVGLPINYYVMVDFAAFKKAIDTVGGITINVEERLYDPTVAWENNWDPLIADVGSQKFDGQRALLYARSRHGSSGGDFDRSRRQREVIVALKDKVFTLGTFGNPIKIAQLLNAFGSHVRTDLSIDNITRLYEIGEEIDGSKVESVSLTEKPDDYVTTGNIGGLSVVLPKAGLYKYNDIQNFVRNKLKDGFIRQEDPKILVVNGTNTSGLASKYRKILRSYGYNVIGIADAPTRSYTQNVFIDRTDGVKKYTKRYMELRFKTEATRRLVDGIEPGEADFVIILGSNETTSN